MKDILSKKEDKEDKYLVPDTCRVPVIYTVPKLHKDQVKPPGRPIINGIQSINSRLGEYVDNYLQPLVLKTPAYLKDMKHLIQELKKIAIQPDQKYILVTADVSSLYTNIGHENAISATKWAMNKFSNLVSKQKRFILRCLAFGLEHNYFWFNLDYYRQLNGIGMGVKYAPSVANLFMAE